jgi:NADH:ubiquinone oxidoreductase subunit 2 (subunit N)
MGTQLFYYTVFSRWLEIALWAITLKIFQQHEYNTDFRSMQGKMAKYPLASITLIIGFLSCAGFPLLASFSTRIILFEQLSPQPVILSWLLIGMGAAIFTGYRLLRLFVPKERFRWSIGESRQQLTLLILGILVLLLLGLFPSVFLRGVYNTLSTIMTL